MSRWPLRSASHVRLFSNLNVAPQTNSSSPYSGNQSLSGKRCLLGPPMEEDKGRHCLVLDLDETLVHSSFQVSCAARTRSLNAFFSRQRCSISRSRFRLRACVTMFTSPSGHMWMSSWSGSQRNMKSSSSLQALQRCRHMLSFTLTVLSTQIRCSTIWIPRVQSTLVYFETLVSLMDLSLSR